MQNQKNATRLANGLPYNFCGCVDSKVLLTKNLKYAANLVNGSVGFAKETIYIKNEISASKLPMYVLTDFGDTYTGKSFLSEWPIKTWVDTNQAY